MKVSKCLCLAALVASLSGGIACSKKSKNAASYVQSASYRTVARYELHPKIGEDARDITEKELVSAGYARVENIRSESFHAFTAGRLPKDHTVYSKRFSDGQAHFTSDCLIYEDNGILNFESCSESKGVKSGDERHLDELNHVREILGARMKIKAIW